MSSPPELRPRTSWKRGAMKMSVQLNEPTDRHTARRRSAAHTVRGRQLAITDWGREASPERGIRDAIPPSGSIRYVDLCPGAWMLSPPFFERSGDEARRRGSKPEPKKAERPTQLKLPALPGDTYSGLARTTETLRSSPPAQRLRSVDGARFSISPCCYPAWLGATETPARCDARQFRWTRQSSPVARSVEHSVSAVCRLFDSIRLGSRLGGRRP
jgi:hypothetical protein